MLKDAKTFLDMASHPPLVVEHSRIHFAQTGSPRIGSLSHALGKGDASSQKLTFFADRQFFFAIPKHLLVGRSPLFMINK